jgi:hypothetical protein
MKVWLRIDEYAKERSFRSKTIKMFCSEGMPHFRDGKNIIIDPKDADNWIKTQKTGGLATSNSSNINDMVENLLRKKR